MRPIFSLMDDERYQVRSRLEGIQILRSIAQSGAVVTAHAGQGPVFTLTTLLDVDVDNDRLYLDVGQDIVVNRRLLESSQVLCVSTQDRVRVQFYADPLELGEFEDRPAFVAKIPDRVMKLQRREYFRVLTPIAHPLLCHFSEVASAVKLPVHDIGLGGLCVVGVHPELDLKVGAIHNACRLDLPDLGMVSVNLEVRNFHDMALRNGTHTRLTGMQFQRLNGTAQNQIQRYVSMLERDHRLRAAE
jgi:c-di-GMP-binding flagellar brake protein YcgR